MSKVGCILRLLIGKEILPTDQICFGQLVVIAWLDLYFSKLILFFYSFLAKTLNCTVRLLEIVLDPPTLKSFRLILNSPMKR